MMSMIGWAASVVILLLLAAVGIVVWVWRRDVGEGRERDALARATISGLTTTAGLLQRTVDLQKSLIAQLEAKYAPELEHQADEQMPGIVRKPVDSAMSSGHASDIIHWNGSPEDLHKLIREREAKLNSDTNRP